MPLVEYERKRKRRSRNPQSTILKFIYLYHYYFLDTNFGLYTPLASLILPTAWTFPGLMARFATIVAFVTALAGRSA
jgi:hypothetical protein